MPSLKTAKPSKKTPKKLLPLTVAVDSKPERKGDVVTVQVAGDYCSRYNEASAIAKQATEIMKRLKPAMEPEFIARVCHENTEHPWQPITSIAFEDEEHNVTRLSFTSKYGQVEPAVVEALFGSLKVRSLEDKGITTDADVNNYVGHTLQASFNSDCFLDEEGRFDGVRYTKIRNALNAVCAELGIANPLTTQKVIKPLPTFHTRRWVDFDAASNERISELIPNQISFTPCPNTKTGKMCGELEDEEKEN